MFTASKIESSGDLHGVGSALLSIHHQHGAQGRVRRQRVPPSSARAQVSSVRETPRMRTWSPWGHMSLPPLAVTKTCARFLCVSAVSCESGLL